MSKIYRCIEFQGVREGRHIPPYIFRLLLKKREKLQEHDLYLTI